MSVSYQAHFTRRGSAYDQAMQRYPHAREEEFIQAVSAAKLTPPMVVADVPAGGGYLQRYLPMGCVWKGHEPCGSFTAHGAVAEGQLLPLPWPDASVDALISLAGVHHVEDKEALFAECHRVVAPGGRLVVSDVAQDSAVAVFLDHFVGLHNSTGHAGAFLNEQTLHTLQEVGWSVETVAVSNFHWVFEHRAAMAEFCRQLFDVQTATHHDVQLAIEMQLGITDRPDGRVGMHWSLQTIVAIKPVRGYHQ